MSEPERDLFGNFVEPWRDEWVGMPEFVQEDLTPYYSLAVQVRDEEALARFESLVGKLYHGKWCWYPPKGYARWKDLQYVGGKDLRPRYPVYVPTKGRWETPLTIRSLGRLNVPFYVVVEPQEADSYAEVIPDTAEILVLPHRDAGLVITRNWIWDHAQASGAERFWTFDDNIDGFYRLNRNAKRLLLTPAFLRVAEDFTDRYENALITGFQYELFAMRRVAMPPFAVNTRIYSNMLIKSDAPYRNEGFYNDDTDLCLRVLKDGHCTVLFNAFLINKIATMRVAGGMTPYYQGDGRKRMAEELQQKHPDVVKVTRKWGRWQHSVDYRPFRTNVLRRRSGVDVTDGIDEYGMVLNGAVQEATEG